jgi:hypothetical protein
MHLTPIRGIGFCCAFAVVSIAISGCGPSRSVRADRARVTGTVTYQGKVVPGGKIKFTRTDGNTAGFKLHEDGTFDIDDVPIGENKVTVDTEIYRPELGSNYVKLPEKYLKPETTNLTFKVEAGENKFDVKLE